MTSRPGEAPIGGRAGARGATAGPSAADAAGEGAAAGPSAGVVSADGRGSALSEVEVGVGGEVLGGVPSGGSDPQAARAGRSRAAPRSAVTRGFMNLV